MYHEPLQQVPHVRLVVVCRHGFEERGDDPGALYPNLVAGVVHSLQKLGVDVPPVLVGEAVAAPREEHGERVARRGPGIRVEVLLERRADLR